MREFRRESGTAAPRKGWCPGALRPMMTRDGLIVRLRITGGIVTADVARALADLAARHGNGLFDLSARGNLQMRGIREASLPLLQGGLEALGLLDGDPDAEAVRNVLASPLAGLHRGLDVRALAAALEVRLAGDRALHALPGKFGFLIDDGTCPTLAGVAADVRFDWIAEHALFSIGLGGTRPSAVRAGACSADTLVEAAALVARGAIGLFATTEARRMRDLIALFGPAGIVARCGADQPGPVLAPVAPTMAAEIVGGRDLGGVSIFGLGVPFGRLDAAMLRGAADLAATAGPDALRLTPWRVLLVIRSATAIDGLDSVFDASPSGSSLAPPYRAQGKSRDKPAQDASRTNGRIEGFITDPRDPRLAIAACVGMMGCARGTTPTHDDAAALASLAAGLDGSATPLHVSGCEKGCAKPSRSRVTLVGRGGRYDLVRDGRAGDAPLLRDLDLAAARGALAALLAPA